MSKIRTIEEIELMNASEPYFGKGIQLAGGFDLGAKSPLDSRAVVKTIDERNAHVTGNRAYEGMLVYVEADKKTYQLIDNNWVEFGFNDEKFQTGIVDALNSDATDKALSARQGKVLDGKITAHVGNADVHVTSEEKAKIAAAASKEELNAAKGELEVKIGEVSSKATANAEAIQAETTRAERVEGALQTSIERVESEYKAADSALDGKINAANQEIAKKAAQTDLEALQGKVANAEGRLDTAEGTIAQNTQAIETEVNRAKAEEGKIRSEFAAADTQLQEQINDIKSTVSGKTKTHVVQSHEEMEAIPNPQIGDLVLVVDERKSYIYSELDYATLQEGIASGVVGKWILFDEITSDVQLDKYLTKELAEATYRKLGAIAKADLEASLSAKIDEIDSKAIAAQVYTKGEVDGKVTEINGKISGVDTKVDAAVERIDGEIEVIQSSITDVESSLSAASTRIDELCTELEVDSSKKSARIKRLETGLDGVDGKITEAIGGLEGKLTPIITAAADKAEANKKSIDALTPRVGTVETELGTAKEGIATATQKIGAVEGRVGALEPVVEANKNAVTRLTADLAATDRQADENTAAINALKAIKEVSQEFAGNVPFVLTETPIEGSVKFFVNGIKYKKVNVSGKEVTWAETDFSLEAGDLVEIVYSCTPTPVE